MRVLAGTSGFSFKEWKGRFYPEKLPAARMLAHYAERLPTVELNNTFYRLPKPHVIDAWRSEVPPEFRFVLKASRRITHQHRLKEGCGEAVEFFLSTTARLEGQLGALLFQLPPNMKKDQARLEAFLELLPAGIPAAFEFRHPSWFEDDDVPGLLARREMGLVVSDLPDEDGEALAPPERALEHGASWGYLRLRADAYSDEELAGWRARLEEASWSTAYVFFKHELDGPLLAGRFLAHGNG